MASKDMFEKNGKVLQSSVDGKDSQLGKNNEFKWRMVTNHQNLMFMLSAGMIMPPEGFGKKYYLDTLSLVRGWVPLFPEIIIKSAVDYSISEQALLRPCYVELDLSAISGEVKVLRLGRWEDSFFPDNICGDEELMLVPAPLPISMIKEIVFSNNEDKKYCDNDAQNFSNVPLKNFKTRSVATPFKKAKAGPWPPITDGIQERQVQLALPDSFGGVLALLNWLSNRNDTIIKLSRSFFSETPDGKISNEFPMLLSAHALFYSPEMTPDNYGPSGALYAKLAKSLVECRENAVSTSPKDTIMETLEASNVVLEGKAKQAGERLVSDLKRIVQFPDKTLDELLETHHKPLPRSLILFLMNDSALDLLEVNSSKLNGYEFSGAAILFGLAEGWMGMSASLRENNDLHLVAPAYMADLSHRLSGSRLNLGSLPDRPYSLLELLVKSPSGKKENDAALHIARACKWQCIKTHIKIGKGEYQLVINGSGANLVLDGDIKAVESEVDMSKFIDLLSNGADIPSRVENEARKMLRG